MVGCHYGSSSRFHLLCESVFRRLDTILQIGIKQGGRGAGTIWYSYSGNWCSAASVPTVMELMKVFQDHSEQEYGNQEWATMKGEAYSGPLDP